MHMQAAALHRPSREPGRRQGSAPGSFRPALPAPLGAARELLQENIAAERKILSNYAKRIDQASEFGDKGLAIRLENMLSAETDHLEELERLGR
jgi:hypothetical protein